MFPITLSPPRTDRNRPRRFRSGAFIALLAIIVGAGKLVHADPSSFPVPLFVDTLSAYWIWCWDNPSDTIVEHFAKVVRMAAYVTGASPYEPHITAPTPRQGASDPALTPVAVSFKDPCPGARSGVVTPGGRFVYMATGDVCAYALDFATGAGTPVPGQPFRAGKFVRAVALDRSGSFLFAVDQDGNAVFAFSIDPATGALTPAPGSPYATGANPLGLSIDGAGRYLYVANNGGASISAYAINAGNGSLTPVAGSPFAAPQGSWAIAADPRGRYVYVAGNEVQAYRIDPATGALGAVGPRIAYIGKGVGVDPLGRFVYVTSGGFDGVAAFRIGVNGELTAVGPPVATGSNPIGVTTDTSGSAVFVANLLSADISAYAIDHATGALTPLPGSPFAAEFSPTGVTATGAMPAQSGATAGTHYAAPVVAGGGRQPYRWKVVDGALPPGLALDAGTGIVHGTPVTAGSYSFVAQISDAAGSSTIQSYSMRVAASAAPVAVDVVEYYNASLDHYFITWVADEIGKLDAGDEIKGWARTGQHFRTYVSPQAGTSPVCRYYIPPVLGNSHFFGRGSAECASTGQKNPSFVQESSDFMQMILPLNGACPAGTASVYRVFSNRSDANHRYMTDRTIRDQMVAKGWLAEGDGPDLVVMCAPGI